MSKPKKQSTLNRLIAESGLKKEFIINNTGIHRNRFYIGLNAPNVFKDEELKAIAKILGVKVNQLTEA